MLPPPALLLLVCLAGPGPAEAGAAAFEAEVRAGSLDVFDEPDLAGYATGQLRRGDRVVVVRRLRKGWLAIEPPAGSFDWIDQTAFDEDGEGQGRIIASHTPVRTGRQGARMPGPPRWELERGERVELLDRAPLVLQQGRTERVWRAIAPIVGEVRYIRAEGVSAPLGDGERGEPDAVATAPRASVRRPERGRALRASERIEPVDRALAMVGPTSVEGSLPASLAPTLSEIEAAHRAILRQPMESWNLEPIRTRYRDLLAHEEDAHSRSILQARLARVERQQALAGSARSVQSLLARSRLLDGETARIEGRIATPPPETPLPYDAEGLLQASSQQFEGRSLYALIGKMGQTIAFVLLPPGIGSDSLVTRQVGVRGRVRFEEALRCNLIHVQEIDPLNDPP